MGPLENFRYGPGVTERRFGSAEHSTSSYDETGRLLRVDYDDGKALALVYGEHGKVVKSTVGEVATECRYDSEGRLEAEQTGSLRRRLHRTPTASWQP